MSRAFPKYYFSAVALLCGVLGALAMTSPEVMLRTLGLPQYGATVTVYVRWGMTIFPLALVFWFGRFPTSSRQRSVLAITALLVFGLLGASTADGLYRGVLAPSALLPLIVEVAVSLGALFVLIDEWRSGR